MTNRPNWTEPDGASPLDDISGIKITPLPSTRDELDVFEAENIQKAIIRYFIDGGWRRFSFDMQDLQKLHREMFGDVWEWAGACRRRNLNIGVEWQAIPERLAILSKDMLFWKDSKMPPAEQAARLHHGMVFVHPFLNGNGRWSRMVTNIWLLQNNQPVIEWPAGVGKTSPIRGDYLAALKLADSLDFSALMDLHARYQG